MIVSINTHFFGTPFTRAQAFIGHHYQRCEPSIPQLKESKLMKLMKKTTADFVTNSQEQQGRATWILTVFLFIRLWWIYLTGDKSSELSQIVKVPSLDPLACLWIAHVYSLQSNPKLIHIIRARKKLGVLHHWRLKYIFNRWILHNYRLAIILLSYYHIIPWFLICVAGHAKTRKLIRVIALRELHSYTL